MSLADIFLIGVGLSMDAFAVAICKGLCMKRLDFRQTAIIALFFGGFQALMPFIGFYLGTFFKSYITSFDHWVAFLLLAYIGFKMASDAFKNEEESIVCPVDRKLDIKELMLLAVATSIDALAVGITFSFYPDTNIFADVMIIGITTFVIAGFGVYIGNKFGTKYKKKAEAAGGIILMLIGIKILLEGLGVL